MGLMMPKGTASGTREALNPESQGEMWHNNIIRWKTDFYTPLSPKA